MIMQVIRQLAKTKTVILISHRLSNVVQSDCIYMLENGALAQAGTHDVLLQQGGPYAALYQQQRALETYGREAAV